MKAFADLNIKTERKSFTGDKLKIGRVLNKPIVVHGYKVENSKYSDLCLHMQIEISGSKHVVFTGSKNLIDMIKQVPQTHFPFSTTITEDNDGSFQFT